MDRQLQQGITVSLTPQDLVIVFAKNLSSKQVEAFIVHLDEPGVSRSMIQNKMALRPVQNGQLYFQNVKIPANRKLPGVKGFESVAKLLAESRLAVAWTASGVGLGVYDFMIKYVNQREQFGRPLTSYQLIQEKLVKVMGLVQSAFLLSWQVQNLYSEGKASLGKIAFVKATATKYIRYDPILILERPPGLVESHWVEMESCSRIT